MFNTSVLYERIRGGKVTVLDKGKFHDLGALIAKNSQG